MIKPVVFENQGQQLVGILHMPDVLEHGGKAPGVVMFHGFTGNKIENHRLFVHVARSLCDSGFVVLRFDFRGSGDSDGEFEDMTIPGEISDAENAFAFLIDQGEVNKEEVGVIGLSMGGRVAAVLASRDERVRFVVLYSAALSPLATRLLSSTTKSAQGIAESMRTLVSRGAVKVRDGWYLKKPFFDTLDDVVPLDVMDQIKVPILIVHSDMDQVVPLSDSTKGFDVVKNLNGKNELCVIEGGDHVFSEREHTQEVIRKTRDWLVSLGLDRACSD